MNKTVVLRYGAALFFYAMLGIGVYLKWWAPTFLEIALESGLAALGIFHSVNYGALNLTASPTALPAPPAPAPTESTVTTSTQGDTHAA